MAAAVMTTSPGLTSGRASSSLSRFVATEVDCVTTCFVRGGVDATF